MHQWQGYCIHVQHRIRMATHQFHAANHYYRSRSPKQIFSQLHRPNGKTRKTPINRPQFKQDPITSWIHRTDQNFSNCFPDLWIILVQGPLVIIMSVPRTWKQWTMYMRKRLRWILQRRKMLKKKRSRIWPTQKRRENISPTSKRKYGCRGEEFSCLIKSMPRVWISAASHIFSNLFFILFCGYLLSLLSIDKLVFKDLRRSLIPQLLLDEMKLRSLIDEACNTSLKI